MKFNFNEKINNLLKIITKNAQIQKVRVFFVGGIVRDNILNRPIEDIDLIIEGNAIEFSKTLPKDIKIKSIHNDFGTVKIIYKNIEVDIASTRTENYPYSGCLPEIKKIGVNIKEDVQRRDFSINSLYAEINYNKTLTYKLIDLVNGIEDIKNKSLRVLHNNSYVDDPTRILRGLNFKYRFNFNFSKKDIELINNYLENINYENTSKDRILVVFKHVLNNLHQDKIFEEIVKNKYYKILTDEDININLKEINKILKKHTLTKEEKKNFYINVLLNNKSEKQDFDNILNIMHFFSKLNNYELAYYDFLHQQEEINYFLEKKNIKIFLQGKDLKKENYPQGKLYTEILNSLYLAKLKDNYQFPTIKEEIEWVKKHYPIN